MIVAKGIPEELRWFYEARFGMFVHFGLYALLGRGEWAQYHEDIPRQEYEKLMKDFNPCLFNADEWVRLARDAGARYIALTTKHHDGFCLFDSALTDYKITNTPFGRDLTGELIDACHRQDMRIVLYYSQPDWHHPNYVHCKGAFKDLVSPPAADRPDWPAYVDYYMGQVEELCTRYGSIDGIWFDGSHKTVEQWKGREVYEMIKKHQPRAVVNDRSRYGDFFTPERSLPEDLTGFLFEACESVSPMAWGYRRDTPSYSAPHLLQSLIRMTAHGGNYLLNVGPAPDGTIPGEQARVMRAMGRWLAIHGPAVYGTDPVFPEPPRTRFIQTKFKEVDGAKKAVREIGIKQAEDMKGQWGMTRAGNRLYFHCLRWPESDRFIIAGVESPLRSVRLMADGSDIPFVQNENGVELRELPCAPPDGLPQVFEMVFDEKPVVREMKGEEKPVPIVPLDTDGDTVLGAEAAALEGYGVKGSRLRLGVLDGSGAKVIEGWWVPEHQARWRVRCSQAGDYRILIRAGCPRGEGGAVIGVTAADQRLRADMPEIAGDGTFPLADAGVVRLPAGEWDLAVAPERLLWGYLFGRVAGVVVRRVSG